jgi:hypothetical protein
MKFARILAPKRYLSRLKMRLTIVALVAILTISTVVFISLFKVQKTCVHEDGILGNKTTCTTSVIRR